MSAGSRRRVVQGTLIVAACLALALPVPVDASEGASRLRESTAGREPLRVRVETVDGVLVVYDAARPRTASRKQAGFLAYWNDHSSGGVYVYEALIFDRAGLEQAILALEAEFGVYVEPIKERAWQLLGWSQFLTRPAERGASGRSQESHAHGNTAAFDKEELPAPALAWMRADPQRALMIMGYTAEEALAMVAPFADNTASGLDFEFETCREYEPMMGEVPDGPAPSASPADLYRIASVIYRTCAVCADPGGLGGFSCCVITCYDGDPCTIDKCFSPGVCHYEPVADLCCGVHCYDGDPCTIDACVNGTCVYPPEPDPCCGVTCNGNDPCTTDACVDGACVYTPVPDPCCENDDPCDPDCGDPCLCMECDDGQWCNGIETCLNGYCLPGTAPCSGRPCDEALRTCGCSIDGECDDGVFCNGPETCVDGWCQPASNPCPPGEFCNEAADRCDECELDAHCQDGDACTEGYCVDGSCSFETVDCTEEVPPCHALTGPCDPASGCPITFLCDDEDPCTLDQCSADGVADGLSCNNQPIWTESDSCAENNWHHGVTLPVVMVVNDDDDNGNGIPDYQEIGPVENEDDLVAIPVSLGWGPVLVNPTCMCEDTSEYTIRLGYTGGPGSYALYLDPAQAFLATEFGPGALPGTVYASGVAATSACGMPLQVQTVCCSGIHRCTVQTEPEVTVVGVTKVEWQTHPGNLELNDCPNNGGRRIFPGKLTPDDSQPTIRRNVDLVATIEPPLPGVTVYFRVFDVDDPFDQLYYCPDGPGVTSNRPCVPNVNLIDQDNPTSGPDNRGTEPLNLPWAASATTDADGQARVTFSVSMQPGNNYRAAASLIQEALTQSTTHEGQLVTPQEHADKLNALGGSWSGYSCPRHWSPMLTVWRKLHVELDSMGPVTGNWVDTQFTGIVGTGTALTEINGLASLDDQSANLDKTPPGNGRFENGQLMIGTPPSTITIAPATANGSNRVVFPTTSIAGLPFFAEDNDLFGNSTMNGTITEVVKSGIQFVWTLNVTASSETPIDWPDFVGGKLRVGGGEEVPIVAANGAASQVTTSALHIPCAIHDDDDDTLLPRMPDVGAMAEAYREAYVLPVYDVGINTLDVPFVLNVQINGILAAQNWDSRPFNANDFWVTYVLTAFQYVTILDKDPDSEAGTFGVTAGGGGSLVFIEMIHDAMSNPSLEEQITVVHETGHAVGNSEDHPVTGNDDQDATFVVRYLVHIRSAPRPWS